MRRYKSALVLLLLLALMAGSYYFYTAIWPKINGGADAETTTPATTTVSYKLVDRTSDELASYAIDYLGERYEVVRETVMEKPEDGSAEREVTRWRLTNRSDIRADTSKLASAAINFCSITSTKLVEENTADLAQFGFGSPSSALVTGRFKDGTEAAIEVGDKNPTNDAYYVRKNGDKTVYLGSTYTAEKLLMKKSDISDLKLFQIAEADVSRIEMSRAGVPLFAAWHKGEYAWELERPVIAPLNSTAQTQLFTSVEDLSAVEYVEVGAKDLSKYGLDKPKYALRFEFGNDGSPEAEPIELLLGNEKAARSTIYAALGGLDDVFVISLESFIYLDKPIKEFVDSFAYIVNINLVNHIEAEFDGISVNCEITADSSSTDDDVFIVDGADVSNLENDKGKSLFRAFYQALIGVLIYDIEPDSQPSGEPEITFLYELKEEPYTMLVEFVPKDDRLYYVFRNKKYAGLVVEKRLFDKPEEGLRATYKAIKDATAP